LEGETHRSCGQADIADFEERKGADCVTRKVKVRKEVLNQKKLGSKGDALKAHLVLGTSSLVQAALLMCLRVLHLSGVEFGIATCHKQQQI
jgi:hypothetical protein